LPGADHGQREPKHGSGAEPPAGFGAEALVGVKGAKSPEGESFLSIFIQKVAKS